MLARKRGKRAIAMEFSRCRRLVVKKGPMAIIVSQRDLSCRVADALDPLLLLLLLLLLVLYVYIYT